MDEHEEAEKAGFSLQHSVQQFADNVRLTGIRSALVSFGGRCYLCLSHDLDHHPDQCSLREKPDISKFDDPSPPLTRSAKLAARSGARPSSRPKTTRSPAEQAAHAAAYRASWNEQRRALDAAAKERTKAFVAQMGEAQPIEGIGPYKQFTLLQLLTLEFALELPRRLDASVLASCHSTINASALQIFAGLL